MKVPKKPKNRSRLPFYWWRRFPVKKKLKPSARLIDKIKNGDFEYPQFFKEAEYEMYWMQEELDAFIENYKGSGNPKTDSLYIDIEKRYNKRRNKLFEDGITTENANLQKLIEELCIRFKLDKYTVIDIMTSCTGNTEKLYLECKKVARKNFFSYINES